MWFLNWIDSYARDKFGRIYYNPIFLILDFLNTKISIQFLNTDLYLILNTDSVQNSFNPIFFIRKS